MNSVLKRLFVATLSLTLFFSCEKEEETSNYLLEGAAFVVNEGTYGMNNGSVMFYNLELNKSSKDIFNDVNKRQLGDVVQSFCLVDDKSKGIIVVNNSQKVEIVNMESFKSVNTINGFSYPRHCIDGKNGYVYVSNGNGYSSNFVYEFSSNSHRIGDSIAVGKGPERMVILNNKLFVANSGGWDLDSTVSVIDLTTRTVIASINVAEKPMDMVIDVNNKLWVFCKGNTIYDENFNIVSQSNSLLVKLNSETYEKELVIDLGGQTSSMGTNTLAISKDKKTIYIENNGIYSVSVDTEFEVLPAPRATGLHIAGSFYSVNVDENTGNIWATTYSYAGNGSVYVYDTTGVKIEEFEAGEYPTEVVFY